MKKVTLLVAMLAMLLVAAAPAFAATNNSVNNSGNTTTTTYTQTQRQTVNPTITQRSSVTQGGATAVSLTGNATAISANSAYVWQSVVINALNGNGNKVFF